MSKDIFLEDDDHIDNALLGLDEEMEAGDVIDAPPSGEATPPENQDTNPPDDGEADATSGAQEALNEPEYDEDELEHLRELASPGSDSVPHARFNEVIEQLKAERLAREAVERRLAEGQPPVASADAQPPQDAEPFDFEGKEQEYTEAVLEGDAKRATAIRSEIRAAEREEVRQQVLREQEQARARDEDQKLAERMQTAAAAAYEAYPFLNPKDASADRDAIAAVIGLRNQYINQGIDAVDALNKAVARLGPALSGKPAASDTPAAAAPNANAGKEAKREAVARNIAAQAAQPPNLANAGAGNRGRGEKVSVGEMTQEQYEALSQEERDEILGIG